MRKKVLFPILAVVLALSLALPMAAVVGAAPDTEDFETWGAGHNPGDSVKGLGTVHADLNISSATENIVLIKTGVGTVGDGKWGYNTTPSAIVNGCLPSGVYGIADGDDDVDEGFEITFGGKTVSSFSIVMLDYGDYFPHAASYASPLTHTIKLVGYDSLDAMVDDDVLTFTSIGSKSTMRTCTSHTWAFGGTSLSVAGDACPARVLNQSPGRWQFTVTGIGIAKVAVEFVGDQSVDSGVGWDNLDFEIENPSLDLTKTADPTSAYEDNTITYTYEVENDGNVVLTAPTVTDTTDSTPLTVNPVLVSTFNVGDDSPQDGKFDPGETWVFTASYPVPWFTAGPVVNDAEATASYGDTEVSDTDFVSVPILHNPDIEIVKVGPGYMGYFESVEATYTYTVTTGEGDCALDITSILDDQFGDLSDDFVGGDTDGDGYLSPDETWTYQITQTLECDGDTTKVITNYVTVVGEDATETEVDDLDCWTVILFQWQPRTIGYWGNWDNHYTQDEWDSIRSEALDNSPNLAALASTDWYGEENVHDFLLGKPPVNKKNDGKEAVQRFHMEKQFLATWLNVKAYLDWVGIDLEGEPLDLTFPGTADVGMDPNAIVYLTGHEMPAGGKVLFGTDALSVLDLLRFIEGEKGNWDAEDFGIAYEVLDIMNNAENNGYLAFMDPTFAPSEICPDVSLDLTKTADVEEAAPGDTINYTYEVHNDGNVTLFFLTVTDEIDGMPLTVTEVTSSGYNVGDINQDGRFEFCETWEFEASFTIPGDYAEETVDNTANAEAWWYSVKAEDSASESVDVVSPIILVVTRMSQPQSGADRDKILADLAAKGYTNLVSIDEPGGGLTQADIDTYNPAVVIYNTWSYPSTPDVTPSTLLTYFNNGGRLILTGDDVSRVEAGGSHPYQAPHPTYNDSFGTMGTWEDMTRLDYQNNGGSIERGVTNGYNIVLGSGHPVLTGIEGQTLTYYIDPDSTAFWTGTGATSLATATPNTPNPDSFAGGSCITAYDATAGSKGKIVTIGLAFYNGYYVPSGPNTVPAIPDTISQPLLDNAIAWVVS